MQQARGPPADFISCFCLLLNWCFCNAGLKQLGQVYLWISLHCLLSYIDSFILRCSACWSSSSVTYELFSGINHHAFPFVVKMRLCAFFLFESQIYRILRDNLETASLQIQGAPKCLNKGKLLHLLMLLVLTRRRRN